MSVVTDSEGLLALKPMAANGRWADEEVVLGNKQSSVMFCILPRYTDAGCPQLHLLYTDRDCYSSIGPSKFLQFFAEWDQLKVGHGVCQM